MAHNITEGNYEITRKDGRFVVVTENLKRGTKLPHVAVADRSTWHGLNQLVGEGGISAVKVGKQLGLNRFDESLFPHFMALPGSAEFMLSGTASLMNKDVKGNWSPMYTVETGDMGISDWMGMNGFSSDAAEDVYEMVKFSEHFRKSKKFETFSPSDALKAVDRKVVDKKGRPVKWNSAFMLGENGKSGFVLVHELPEWQPAIAEKLQTNVRENLVIYVHPTEEITVFLTNTFVICENTLRAGLSTANRTLKVSHDLGIADRVDVALEGVYTEAITARTYTQDMINFINTITMTPENVREVLDNAYGTERSIRETYISKNVTTLAGHKADIEKRQELKEYQDERQNARLAAMTELAFTSDTQESIGITNAMKSGNNITGLGTLQLVTWDTTHSGNFESNVLSLSRTGGVGTLVQRRAIQSIVKQGDLSKAPAWMQAQFSSN